MKQSALSDAIQNGNLIFKELNEIEEKFKGQTPGDPFARRDFEDLHRKLWAISAEILRLHVRSTMVENPPEAFPYDLLMRLSKLFEGLGGGNIHPIITNAKKVAHLKLRSERQLQS